MGHGFLARWARFLFFRASAQDIQGLRWQLYLVPGLLATWLAGMGRHWDHPAARPLERLGVGSLVYVFALSAFLWLLTAPLRPARWRYVQVLTLVTLTSPPAWLYAIPVERFLSLNGALEANVLLLGVVAVWRVGLLMTIFLRYGGLPALSTIVATLLPLTAIVASLYSLSLDAIVYDVMAGFRSTYTPESGVYVVLQLLTGLSMLVAGPLVLAYLALVVARFRGHQV